MKYAVVAIIAVVIICATAVFISSQHTDGPRPQQSNNPFE